MTTYGGATPHKFFNQHSSLFGLELGLLDGHLVIYAFHTLYVVDEFGGQLLFGCVLCLATQCDHAPFWR
jgi:hypothetical protein